MKYLKTYNESLTDVLISSSKLFTQEDLDDIKDIFQDVIDECSLEKNFSITHSCYNISLFKDRKQTYFIDYTNLITITVLISEMDNNRPEDFLKSVVNIVERYSAMGYHSKFTRQSTFYGDKIVISIRKK